MTYNSEKYANALREYTKRKTECFIVLPLTKYGRIITRQEVQTKGSENECYFTFEDILEVCEKHNCKQVIVSHNHPTDTATPSLIDNGLTIELRHYLKDNGIILLDHIIVSKTGFYSYKDDDRMRDRPTLVLTRRVC